MKRTIKVHAMLRTAFVTEVELDLPDDFGTATIEEAIAKLAKPVEWTLDGPPELNGDGDDEVYEFEEQPSDCQGDDHCNCGCNALV